MDKLKELLRQGGASDELVDAICEEFDRLSGSIKKRHDGEFDARIERAKEVCFEEVNKEKTSLARKVKVYLESKARAIEEAAERQRNANVSEDAVKVRRAIEILNDGISPDAASDQSRELAAARRLNARLENVLGGLKEERNTANARATRAYTIAEKSLDREKTLESKVKSLNEKWEKGEEPWAKKGKKAEKSEDSDADGEGEEATEECDTPTESKKPARKKRRLSESRTVKAKSKVATPINEGRKPESGDARISDIASAIPEID